jgi:hypothetical protein
MALDLRGGSGGLDFRGLRGRLLLTSHRLCFLPEGPADAGSWAAMLGFSSGARRPLPPGGIDLPLAGLVDVAFRQPLLGANALAGAVRAFDAASRRHCDPRAYVHDTSKVRMEYVL